MIPVTKPFLPPREEYESYVQGIFERNWLTNNGPLVNKLELLLKRYLEIDHLLYVTNGTIAIQLALKVLRLKGKVLTTPFSYVATTSSIVWENLEPVFVDIDAETLNIDADLIEEKITDDTSAILATHVYGNPCDIEKIQSIAKKYNLQVIYDAAHCFGSKYQGRSVLEFGDISATSFHATKVFHTIEGGAVCTPDPKLLYKMAKMRNFGHEGPTEFAEIGINAKNSEFHAAMGLANLKYIDEILRKRKELSEYYDHALRNLRVGRPRIYPNAAFNYAYYVIIFENEKQLVKSLSRLNNMEIYPRRYFYPSLTSLPYTNDATCPIASDFSSRVMCLPLYHTLGHEEIDMVARALLREQNYSS